MSISTFGTRQPLKSLEFGTLLHGLVHKGVYTAPTITVSGGSVTVTGGVFLFYDTVQSNYVVRVENVSLTKSDLSAGQWLFISYTYNPATPAEPSLSGSESIDSSSSTIRLGRLIQTSGGLAFDLSSMEMCVVDNGILNYLNYNVLESNPVLSVGFNESVTTNTITKSVNVSGVTGVDASKAQYLYVNTDGYLKCADSTVPRFGKLVVAEKPANGNFTPIQFPHHAEIKAMQLEVDKPPVSAGSKEETMYQHAASKTADLLDLPTGNTIIALQGMIQILVDHIATLERNVDDLTRRLIYLEKVKAYVGRQLDIPDAEHIDDEPSASKLVMENVEIKSIGNVNIKGSVTVDSNTSSFGTSTDPIHNLYVVNSLYTDRLFVTE